MHRTPLIGCNFQITRNGGLKDFFKLVERHCKKTSRKLVFQFSTKQTTIFFVNIPFDVFFSADFKSAFRFLLFGKFGNILAKNSFSEFQKYLFKTNPDESGKIS